MGKNRWEEIPLNWKSVTPGSKRERKGRFRSPNEFLIQVLRGQSDAWDLPRVVAGKANLSYASPFSPHAPEHPGYFHPFEKFRPSQQYYLARYIEVVHRKESANWETPLDPKVKRWLRRQGYSEVDFRIWGKILTADDTKKAAVALLEGGIDGLVVKRPVPVWVACLLLRRKGLSDAAVQTLLVYAEQYVNVGPDRAFQGVISTDEKTSFILCLRLLRQARIVCPSSIQQITNLVVARINPSHVGTIREEASDRPVDQERLRKRRTRLTFFYNRVLTLLSLPTSIRPYVSAADQLRAQFDVLRRMSEYQPPLVISQEGYRAVARLQLAHLKSREERKWAELKSNSWPPWKEDRTAMDSLIGPDDGVSRAGQTIMRMSEAGYPAFGWDKVINLFAGWDSDGSPVIQNRFILPRIQNALVSALNEKKMPNEFPCVRDVDHQIWAARVRTTRTVEESWAIFLAYEAVKVWNVQRRLPVYMALFERILGVQKLNLRRRRRSGDSDLNSVEKENELPGDAREALPTPTSPHERLDPRLQPPSFDELFNRMTGAGIYADNACVAYLVRTASRFSRGLDFIRASRDLSVRAMLDHDITEQWVKAAPEDVFNAYVYLLCRFCWVPDKYHRTNTWPHTGDRRPLIHRALALMDRRKSTNRPGWNRILSAVHKFDTKRGGSGTTELMRQTLKVMEGGGVELDAEGFEIVCLSFRFQTATREARIAQQLEESFDDVWGNHFAHNHADSLYLRMLFGKVVGLDNLNYLRAAANRDGGEVDADPDRFLAVPSPSVMHNYIRALGTMGDHEGLLSIATFMHDHVEGLLDHCENELNGHFRLRRAVVALRVFVERSWEEPRQQQQLVASEDGAAEPVSEGMQPAPEELVMLVKEKVEAAAVSLGYWPSDDEVGEYVQWGLKHGSL